MRSPADVRAVLRSAYDRHVTAWLLDPAAATRSIPLHPPSAAQARRDPDAVGDFVAAWRGAAVGAGISVSWEVRRWSGYGEQELPVRMVVEDARALAEFAGRARDWQALQARWVELLRVLGGTSSGSDDTADAGSDTGTDDVIDVDSDGVADALARALRRHLTQWRALTAADASLVLQACRWFLDHPGSGLQIRQVPIAGMHTKWLQSHRALVTDLVRAARGGYAAEGQAPEGQDPLGLAPTPVFSDLVILDPALRIGGIRLLRLEQTELARLPVDPEVVLICENAETVQVLGDIPGVVAIHGGGYRGGDIAELPWVQRAPVLYWGDLDGHGFGVLHRVRSHHSDVTSVLMDHDTLHRHRELWGQASRGAPMELSELTAEESAVRRELAGLGEAQLEQERIEITYAMRVLREAVEAIRRR